MSDAASISVVIPTHNPHRERFARTMAGLRAQTLDPDTWELLIVDNASTDRSAFHEFDLSWQPRARLVTEAQLGLTAARLRGFRETTGKIIILVDDDNVLAPGYLAAAAANFVRSPEVGVAGGRVTPRFELEPPDWTREFFGNLALCDHGEAPLVSESWSGIAIPRSYPKFAPVGAGLAVRRAAAENYARIVAADAGRRALDRSGQALVSGGDNDLVMTALESGWRAAYWPELALEHLIPPARLTRDYLGRLNFAIARSWIRVLRLHQACPWPPVGAWTVPLRQARAWFRHQPWRGPAQYVRWRYACGHFAGLAD
jgi:glycosyltransferase involved in cell wall biosynthesis